MSKTLIPESLVHCDVINKENVTFFSRALEEFSSKDENINKTVHEHADILAHKEDYDNRNQIMGYYIGDGQKEKIQFIGVFIFSASSLKVTVNSPKDGLKQVIFPSVRIETFGVNDCMTKSYASIIQDDKEEISCAKFIMNHFLDYLDEESKRIGITHVHLHAINNDGVLSFYEECNFREIPHARVKLLFLEGEGKEFNYICTLRNAVNRSYV